MIVGDDWIKWVRDKGKYNYEYLFGQKLTLQKYDQIDEHAHEHCELCWGRISQHVCDSHEGYATEDGRWWLCISCYETFRDTFEWA